MKKHFIVAVLVTLVAIPSSALCDEKVKCSEQLKAVCGELKGKKRAACAEKNEEKLSKKCFNKTSGMAKGKKGKKHKSDKENA